MTECPRCRTQNTDEALHCVSCRAYLGWTRGRAGSAARPAAAGDAGAEPPRPAPPIAGAAHLRQQHQPPAAPADPITGRPTPAQASSGQPPAVPLPTARQSAAPPSTVPPSAAHPSAAHPSAAHPSTARPAADPPSNAAPVPKSSVPPARTAPPAPIPERGPMPTVPQRSIGVRVSSQPSRLPPRTPQASGPYGNRASPGDLAAVRPQDALTDDPSRAGSDRSPTRAWPDPPRPGEVACPRCGRGVAPERRFCRCGASLGTQQPPAARKVAARRLPWYRRLGELIGGGRDFRRAMRAANGGLRVTYDAALAGRARVMRATMLLATLGFAISQLGPWGPGLRDQMYERVDRLVPHQYDTVPVDAVTTDPAVRDVADFGRSYAADGKPERAWAQRWLAAPAGGQRCQRPGGAPALVIGFRREARVERVVIRAGLAKDNNQRELQFRPRSVDIMFSDGTCHVAELKDTADPQTVAVDVPGVTHARVVIVDVYPPADQGDGLVSLSEISFDARR